MAWHGLVIDDIEEHNSRLLSLSHVETAALPFAPIPSADSEVKISVWRAGRLWIPYGMILLGKVSGLTSPQFQLGRLTGGRVGGDLGGIMLLLLDRE